MGDAPMHQKLLTPRRVSLNENAAVSLSAKFGRGEGIGELGVGYCMFTMINAVIGVGIVTLPIAFSKVGIVPGFCLLFLCAIIAISSLYLVGRVCVETGSSTYGTPRHFGFTPPRFLHLTASALCYGCRDDG